MSVLVLVDDLVFQEKIRTAASAAAIPVEMVSHIDAWTQGLKQTQPTLLVADLNATHADPLEAIRLAKRHAPTVPMIAYCAHVQHQLQEQARHAGCTQVLPRSVFVQRLPELLGGR